MFYLRDTEIDIDDDIAAELIALHHAVAVAVEAVPPVMVEAEPEVLPDVVEDAGSAMVGDDSQDDDSEPEGAPRRRRGRK